MDNLFDNFDTQDNNFPVKNISNPAQTNNIKNMHVL